MTLATFRQLPKEPLINPDTGELGGVPWGWINYFWGACKYADHLHIVWQKGDELRRACEYEPLKLPLDDGSAGRVPAGVQSGQRAHQGGA